MTGRRTMSELKFTKEHCWCRAEGDELTCGISDYAQGQMSELTFVELPEPGRKVKAGEAVAVVESVKAANDVFAPVAGTVTAANAELEARPELVNEDPYGAGWIFKMRTDDAAAVEGLMGREEYEAGVGG